MQKRGKRSNGEKWTEPDDLVRLEALAREYIKDYGGFEKFAEWGLI